MLPYNENNWLSVDLADAGFSADDWQFDVPFENCQMVGEPFFEMNENGTKGNFILKDVKIIDKTTNEVLFTFDMTGDEKNVGDKTQLDR